MALRRREIELSLERPVGAAGPAGGVVRVSVRFDSGPDGVPPSVAELADALDGLRADLDALVGAPLAALPAAQGDRSLDELVETYHPRQRELVDLLRDEGELTSVEHVRLVEYLGAGVAEPRPAPIVRPEAPPRFDQPIAAAPIGAVPVTPERTGESARPVAELIRQYQIASLKQAGAVRARRQISFEEYMALKRHFQPADSRPAERPT